MASSMAGWQPMSNELTPGQKVAHFIQQSGSIGLHPATLLLDGQPLSTGQASLGNDEGSQMFFPAETIKPDTVPIHGVTLRLLDTGASIALAEIHWCDGAVRPHFDFLISDSQI